MLQEDASYEGKKKAQEHHPCIEIFSFPDLKRVQKGTCFERKQIERTYIH